MWQRSRRGSLSGVALWGLVLCWLSVAGGWPSALAQGSIRVVENAHATSFGREMRFSLQVESANPITSVVLAYRTSDTRGTTVETMAVSPATSLRVEHVHEIARRYVRPFVEVTYWWTIVDAAQARLVTEPRSFTYGDDRYEWQTVTGDAAHVHWYRGDLKIAQQALDVAAEGLSRASQYIGADGDIGADEDIGGGEGWPMDVYLYASRADMLAALPPGSPPDVEAMTLNGMNVVLVSFPPEAAYIPDLRRVLPHEAAHVRIHEVTQDAHDRVPSWLSEGLATSVQYTFVPDPVAETMLEEAARQDALIPLLDLCAAFPRDATSARLAYAESASVIGYIGDRHGLHAVRDLIAAYVDGATCEGGVYRVLGITLDGLEARWRADLAPQAGWGTFWRANGAWIILLLLITAFPLAFLLPLRARAAALGEKRP
jgi:hypothetical protein